MLKTNSSVVRKKIRKFIIDSYDDIDGYDEICGIKYVRNADFDYVSKFIVTCFVYEYLGFNREMINRSLRFYGNNYFNAFHHWCGGFPSVLETAYYYYNNSAVDVLGDILEQTEIEKQKYFNDDSEQLLDMLIYRELTKSYSVDEAIRQILLYASSNVRIKM